MVGENSNNSKTCDNPIVRLHERWMDQMEQRVARIESNLNKIPWILLVAIITAGVSLLNLILFLKK